jgi:hypothetical protein
MKLQTLHPRVQGLHSRHIVQPIAEPDNYGRGRGGRPWRRKRAAILTRDQYLCQPCRRAGLLVPATEVDHRIPVAFDGTDDDSNLQAICGECHDIKTRAEANSARATMTPPWLPVCQKPMHLVCGPPASGKSAYVREHAAAYDLVVDLDLLAEHVTGHALHTLDKRQRQSLIRQRNDVLASYMRGETSHPTCWLLAVSGSPRHRDFWRNKGAVVTVMRAPKALCLERIAARELPDPIKWQQRWAVEEWQ